MTTARTVRVAVTQHEPVWLDLEGTVQKTIKIIEEAAAAAEAKIVAFPECWIPGYPTWIWSRPVDFDLGTKYVQNCLKVNSPEMKRIQDAARDSNISVALGFSERDGEIQMTRRKLKPTHMERTIFGDASGDCLAKVVDLPEVGKGEQIHIAAWPPLDPFVDGSPGFYSMSVEGCRNQAQSYSIESQTFVLHATTVLSQKGVDTLKTAGAPIMGSAQPGSSAVIGPDGRILSEPGTADGKLIIADLDLNLITKTRTFADAAGHYSRPDLMWLGVDDQKKSVVRHETK